MTCFAAKHLKVDSRKRQTVTLKVSFLYVFDRVFRSYFIFPHFSGIFLGQKQHTCLQNILLSENKSSVQQPPTSNVWRQNMSCFHPIRTCFFFTCTRLDLTDGIIIGIVIVIVITVIIIIIIYCSVITSSLLRSRSCRSYAMPPPPPPSSPHVGAGRGACVTPGRAAAKETTHH